MLKKILYVSAGVILDNNYKILLSKRKKNKHLPGYWEFPGGKLEMDETPEVALKRELKEECDIKPIIKNKIGIVKHSYSHFSISLHCYNCVLKNKNLINNKNSKWITNEEIYKFPFPKANHKIFEILNNYGWNL